jgi:hypothetical protein
MADQVRGLLGKGIQSCLLWWRKLYLTTHLPHSSGIYSKTLAPRKKLKSEKSDSDSRLPPARQLQNVQTPVTSQIALSENTSEVEGHQQEK